MKFVLLQETLHIHNDSNESHEDIEALENGTTVKRVQKNENLFLNWPLVSSIIVCCVFALHDMAYQEVWFLLNDCIIRLYAFLITCVLLCALFCFLSY